MEVYAGVEGWCTRKKIEERGWGHFCPFNSINRCKIQNERCIQMSIFIGEEAHFCISWCPKGVQDCVSSSCPKEEFYFGQKRQTG